jgi:hypothetical protein
LVPFSAHPLLVRLLPQRFSGHRNPVSARDMRLSPVIDPDSPMPRMAGLEAGLAETLQKWNLSEQMKHLLRADLFASEPLESHRFFELYGESMAAPFHSHHRSSRRCSDLPATARHAWKPEYPIDLAIEGW